MVCRFLTEKPRLPSAFNCLDTVETIRSGDAYGVQASLQGPEHAFALLQRKPRRFTCNIDDLSPVRITQPMKRQQQLRLVIPHCMKVRRWHA